MITPRLMKAHQAAKYLDISLVAFAALEMPWRNLDGMCRFDRRDLDALGKKELEKAKATAVCYDLFDTEYPLPRHWGRKADRDRVAETLRAEILLRDGEICRYCGTTDGPWEIDHIHPVCRGGSNEPENLTVACRTCNRQKGSKTVREWRGEEQ